MDHGREVRVGMCRGVIVVPGTGKKCCFLSDGSDHEDWQNVLQACWLKKELIPFCPRSVTPNSLVFDKMTGSVKTKPSS